MKIMAAASIAGYLIVFFSTPLITRLYTPADIGIFSVFGTIIMLVLPLLSMGNEVGINNERKLTNARRFYFRGIGVSLVGFFVLTMGAIIFYVAIDLPWQFIALPSTAFFAVLYALSSNWQIRKKNDLAVARGIFVSLASRTVLQTALGCLGTGINGLIFGEFFGRFLSLFCVDRDLVFFRKKVFMRLDKPLFASAINNYSRYVTPKIFVENFIIWFPAMAFTALYGAEFGGLVAIAQRFGSTPATIFNQAVGTIFHRSLVVSGEDYPCGMFRFVIATMVGLLLVYVVAINALGTYGQAAGSWLLGEKWTMAGQVLLLMLPMYIAQVGSVLVEKIMLFYNFLALKLIANIVHGLVLIVVICYAYYTNSSDYLALEIVSLSVALSYLLLICAFMLYIYARMRFGR